MLPTAILHVRKITPNCGNTGIDNEIHASLTLTRKRKSQGREHWGCFFSLSKLPYPKFSLLGTRNIAATVRVLSSLQRRTLITCTGYLYCQHQNPFFSVCVFTEVRKCTFLAFRKEMPPALRVSHTQPPYVLSLCASYYFVRFKPYMSVQTSILLPTFSFQNHA